MNTLGSAKNKLSWDSKKLIIDLRWVHYYVLESGVREFVPGECYGWRQFAPYSALMDSLVDDKYVIRVEVEVLVMHYEKLSLDSATLPSISISPEPEPETEETAESQKITCPALPLTQKEILPSPQHITSRNLETSGKLKLSKQVKQAMKSLGESVGPDGPVEVHCGFELFRVNKWVIAG